MPEPNSGFSALSTDTPLRGTSAGRRRNGFGIDSASPFGAGPEDALSGGRMDDPVEILLVDDAPDKMLALEAALSDLGQPVVKAQSGNEALRLVLKREFAVILLDINMPGMDGFETASLIRQRKSSAHTPIIFVTSFSTADVEVYRGYSLGAVDYILAPVVPEVLRSKVKVFVDLHQMQRRIRRQADERVALADDAPVERLRELEDGFDLVLHHAAHRNAGPVGHDGRNRVRIDAGEDQRGVALHLA